jgi:hypothetical protein
MGGTDHWEGSFRSGDWALAAVPRAAHAGPPMVRAASRIVVLGQEQEQEHIAKFLDEIPRGPAILLIEGEAGIGKTTLWEFGVEAALDRGYEVLVTRPPSGGHTPSSS